MSDKAAEIKMIPNSNPLLSSYSFIACIGSPGSGKTTQMINI